jgi:osmotically inducible protein OsmC
MAVRHAEAVWEGTLQEGSGIMKVESGAFEGRYTRASRFEDGEGTNPEELIGAAHAGCYSMFLSAILTRNGYTPTSIHTNAAVHIEAGPTITKIELDVEAAVAGVEEAQFQQYAEEAKTNCPVSKALSGGPEIILNARLNP